jgi:phosphatidylinositol glycan class V
LLLELPPEAGHALVALALSAGAFCLAALSLHRLTLRVLAAHKDCDRLANLSLLFFCCNPASVFYSAAYSESLFAAATWLGLLLLPGRHWAAVGALMVAAAARSNGILGAWSPLHKLLAAARRQGRLPLGEALRAGLSCCAILAPYAAMQGVYRVLVCLRACVWLMLSMQSPQQPSQPPAHTLPSAQH